jgi:serine/threonine protein kinase
MDTHPSPQLLFIDWYNFLVLYFLELIQLIKITGDMRYNLRNTSHARFPEYVARFYICQVLLALDQCHKAQILHRGKKTNNSNRWYWYKCIWYSY